MAYQTRKINLTTGVLLLIYFNLFGQTDIKFDRISVENGLSQSSVQCIAQDKYGFLWIGTMDGLNRYDGNFFRIYRNDRNDSSSIPSNNIKGLFETKNGDIWISTSGYLSKYDEQNKNFISFPAKLNNLWCSELEVAHLEMTTDSTLLLGTNRGVINFDIARGVFSKSGRFSDFDDSSVRKFSTQSRKGGHWVATDKALFGLNPLSGKRKMLFSHREDIYVTEKDSTHVLVQTRDCLRELLLPTSTVSKIEVFPSEFDFDSEERGQIVTASGDIWVFRRSIRVYDSSLRLKYQLQGDSEKIGTLPDNQILTAYESKGGAIWVGTNAFGLYKHIPNTEAFRYLGNHSASPVELSSSTIWDVLSENDKQIFLLTYKGFDVVDTDQKKVDSFKLYGKDGERTYGNKLFKDTRGIVWLCTKKGLMRFNSGKISVVDDAILGDPTTNIYDFAMRDTINYLLTTNKGTFLWNIKSLRSQKVTAWISKPIGIYKGKVFLEKGNQLVSLDVKDFSIRDSLKKGSESHMLPQMPIKCFFEDRDGTLWIGTWGGGLSRYDDETKTFKSYGVSSGLRNMVVYMILEDDDGLLWFSTNQGLHVFNKVEGRVERYFEVEDGVQGNEFNTRSGSRSTHGMLYFGGINGATFFDPREVKRIVVKTPISIISAIYIDNKSLTSPFSAISNEGNQLEINWQHDLRFDVSALGFSFPKKIRMEYILENFNDEWVSLGDNRRINFTNIPPGKYVLRVRAANPNGIWEEPGIVLPVIVKAPFWTRPWFWLISIVIVCFLILVVYKIHTYRLTNRNRLLTKLVLQRTNELTKLNEEINAQNERLSRQADVMRRQFQELESIKNEQEETIKDRTREIQSANEGLVHQNAQLEQFAFITSHNIRGPLARIKGLVNILSIDNVETDHLKKSVNQLDEIISDLSMILNVRKGIDVHKEKVNLRDQLLVVLDLLNLELKEASAVLEISNFANITTVTVKAYVTSIFYNLLSNSLKYRHAAKRLLIHCSCQEKNDLIEIVFSDNGIGIDMKFAEDKIFKLYQRFHTEKPGRGFGLYMVKNQVEMLSGSISLKTDVDEGTSFKIVIPLNSSISDKGDRELSSVDNCQGDR